MNQVVVDLSMSLDGFITGPNDGIELPLSGGVRFSAHTGTEPIELERLSVIESSDVTYLGFRIVK